MTRWDGSTAKAAAACLAAALLGWVLAQPQQAADVNVVTAGSGGWRVSPLPPREASTTTLPRVATASWWGGPEAAPAEGVPADARWRVAGLFGVGAQRVLRVEFKDGSRPGQSLKVGDKLPSGHTITEIGDREYCIRIGGRSYTLGVERSDPH